MGAGLKVGRQGPNMSVVRFGVELALGVVLTVWVLRRDLARLGPRELARSWNDASFWSAVVAFGPLCVPVHFTRTRRSARGFLLGVAWTALVITALSVVDALLAALA